MNIDYDKTKNENKTAKRALSRSKDPNQLKSTYGFSLHTRSQMLLSKIDGGKLGEKARGIPSHSKSIKTLHLVLLGKNEMFGLDEILEDLRKRVRTVTCASKSGKCYYLSKENFIHCVNLFKFS